MAAPDERTAATLIRQWEKLNAIKNSLIKAGLLTGDATPAAVLAKLREVVPADLFK